MHAWDGCEQQPAPNVVAYFWYTKWILAALVISAAVTARAIIDTNGWKATRLCGWSHGTDESWIARLGARMSSRPDKGRTATDWVLLIKVQQVMLLSCSQKGQKVPGSR